MLFTTLALVAVVSAAPSHVTRDFGAFKYANNVRLHPNGDKTLCLQPKGGALDPDSPNRRQDLEIATCSNKSGERWNVGRDKFSLNATNIEVAGQPDYGVRWVIGSNLDNPSAANPPPPGQVALQPNTDDDPEPYNDKRWVPLKSGQIQRLYGGTFHNYSPVPTTSYSCLTVDGDIAPGAGVRLEGCAQGDQVNPKQIWIPGPVPGESSELGTY